jgi:hypothetical protein
MRRFVSVAIVAMLALAGATAAGCGLTGGSSGKRVTIPPEYRTANATYTLLYNTLGYESAATKHVLVRQNDTTAPVSPGAAFAWRLIDDKGSQVAVGRATFGGTAWGIPLWVADFSKVTKAGEYRLVVEGSDAQLATEPFPIGQFLMFEVSYDAIALQNAAARSAPIEVDNGYFDSNERSGTVSAHADFLVGLLESYDRRSSSLTNDERQQTRDAIDRAVDYLLLVSDPGTGAFDGQSATRPFVEDGPTATVAGLRGLAHFAALAKTDEPDRADRALRRARLAEQWLDANAPAAYTPSMRAAVDYDLYRAIGDQATLDLATKAVRDAVGAFDMRTMDRRSDDTLPYFEAMYRMWRDLPSNPDYAFWKQSAAKAAAQYKDMLGRSAFQLIPPGVTDATGGTSAADQWDQIAAVPPPGEGVTAVVSNEWFMARSIDAIYLAQMTHDADLEKVATAGLAWVSGLNPGVPTERVVGADAVSPYMAASFLTGLSGRSVATWSSWEWQRTTQFATIVNGFRGGFAYDDGAAAGDTSLRNDGIWLYATSVYDDYLYPAKQAPPTAARALSSPSVRVASATPSQAEGALALLVTVTGPNGAPDAGANVTVAWTGTALPGALPADTLRTTQCVTVEGGSCIVTIAPDALPVQRPILAAVTNVEDLRYRYDPTGVPAPVVFP